MQAIKTVLLSYGMSGRLFHAPFLEAHPGLDFHAVWERTKNEAVKRYPQVVTYRTLEELLQDNAVELVIVNTPNYTHYDYTKKALLAGKHVIVEKPFVVTVEEGEELIRLAEQKEKLLSVYHNRRFDSDYKTINRIIKEGWLGKVVEAEFHFDRYRVELSPKQHKEAPGKGTGALYDLGSHIIDQAVQLFGMPDAVFADIRTVRPLSEVDDYFELLLYYPQLRVRLHCSYLVRQPLPGYILHGDKGSFIKEKTNVQEEALENELVPGGENWGVEPEEQKGFLHADKDGRIVKEYVLSERGNYMDFFDGMYKAIRKNSSVPVRAEDGLTVIRIIEAAFRSNGEKRIVDL